MSNEPRSRYAFEKLSILIVDDSTFTREMVETVLRALGVRQVHQAADAAAGFVELRTHPIDIAFVDWVMDPLDGLDFTRLVRDAKDSPNPFLPIIMLTGHTELWRVEQARDVGVNEFLAKPFSAKSLYRRVVSIIDNPRPYIRTKTYFGPDRRRRDVGPPPGVPERRWQAPGR